MPQSICTYVCAYVCFGPYSTSPARGASPTMSVSVFANTLRTHSRLRVRTATRVTLPTTRCINSLITFGTSIPKNVSFSVSRSFTISQVARNELEDGASSVAPGDEFSNTIFAGNVPWNATELDLAKAFHKFGHITDIRLSAFFFLTFFFSCVFLKNHCSRQVPEWSFSGNLFHCFRQ